MSTAKDASRTGLVLAAGFGSRLKGSVDETSLKPLTPVAGIPLIFRTIQSLQKAGCRRVVIVLGHGNEQIQESIEHNYSGSIAVDFAYNENFDLANGVSVLTAKPLISGEFILTMADHILGDGLMDKARTHTPPAGGATLLVDYKIDSVFDLDDATKVQERDNRIARIGKGIEDYNCIDTGVFVCTQGLMEALEQQYQKMGDVSLSQGVQKLSEQGLMRTLDIEDGFWQDVDTPAMLAHAEQILESESR